MDYAADHAAVPRAGGDYGARFDTNSGRRALRA
jgi:hypothetical protein